MALLTPNATYTACGVTVNEKIIPDGTRWKSAAKAKAAGFSANSLYKRNEKLSGNTGKVQSVTIHNTNDLDGVYDDAEQYTRATYNENMKSSRVHFYVDDTGAWQNLKAGLGMCSADPVGSAEVSWHSGDGSATTGGNMTSLSIEIIMGDDTKANDTKSRDNGARLAAFLLYKHGLSIDKLYTHTYWVNKSKGKSFSDPDEQSTNLISGYKWCPTYIFGSTNHATALKNWKAFKALVKTYLDELNGGKTLDPAPIVKEDPKPTTTKLSIEEAAKAVYAGKYGNGDARKAALRAAGYTDAEISAIQSRVNELVSGKKTTAATTKPVAKDLDAAAKDVYAGKYGNGDARKAALKKAGYTDAEISTIQQKVNDLVAGKKATTSTPKPVAKDLDAAARKVLRGDYGNGDARKAALKKAGYTNAEIATIQQKVNALCK